MGLQLGLSEVVQTESSQRILLQKVRLDRIVASLAEGVRVPVDSLERGVHFSDEIVEVVSRNRAGSGLQPSSPLDEQRPGWVSRWLDCGIHFENTLANFVL